MKPLLLVLLAALPLGLTISACGGAGRSSSLPSSTATATSSASASHSSAVAGGYWHYDSDRDPDDQPHGGNGENDDRNLLAEYGSEAGQADKRAVTAIVKRYYAAAAADDGASVCELLDASLATGLSGSSGEKSCAAFITRLFSEQHRQFATDDVATMVVSEVRVKEDFGLAVLGFRASPESEILLEREGHVWKLAALFDSPLP